MISLGGKEKEESESVWGLRDFLTGSVLRPRLMENEV